MNPPRRFSVPVRPGFYIDQDFESHVRELNGRCLKKWLLLMPVPEALITLGILQQEQDFYRRIGRGGI